MEGQLATEKILGKWRTLRQFAKEVHRSEDTVRRWLRQGKGPVVTMVAGRKLLGDDDIEAWMLANRVEPMRTEDRRK